jgi:hypothetical protein
MRTGGTVPPLGNGEAAFAVSLRLRRRLIPADAMRAFPVGPAVNGPKNDGPECPAPVA